MGDKLEHATRPAQSECNGGLDDAERTKIAKRFCRMKKIDYKSYDAATRWHFPADLRRRAAELGYQYISEMIAGEYARFGGRRAAAKSIGVTGHTIWRHIRLMGFPPRPRGGANNHCKWATPEIDAKIRAMDSKGIGYRAIATTMGRSIWQVRDRMETLGLIPKKNHIAPVDCEILNIEYSKG